MSWADQLSAEQAEAYADHCTEVHEARMDAWADAQEAEAERADGRLADRLVIGGLSFDLSQPIRRCGRHGLDTTSGRCPACDLASEG